MMYYDVFLLNICPGCTHTQLTQYHQAPIQKPVLRRRKVEDSRYSIPLGNTLPFPQEFRCTGQLSAGIPLWCGVAFNEECFSHMLILARNERSVVLRCASSNFRRTALFLWSSSTTLKLRTSGPVTFPTSNNEWHTRHRLWYRKSGLMVWMRPEQICKQVAAVWGNVWTHHCTYQ